MITWYRVGGGLEHNLQPEPLRHGPADADHPPPGRLLPVFHGDRLAGWAEGPTPEMGPEATALGELRARALRERLLERLDHKLRGGLLALEASAAGAAATGDRALLGQVHDLAREVRSRAEGLASVVLEPRDGRRPVVLRAALAMLPATDSGGVPAEALVEASEQALRDLLERLVDWMGGAGCAFEATLDGRWWRLRVHRAGPSLASVPELGEPLVRHLVDFVLEGWLAPPDAGGVTLYLPAPPR